MPGYSCDLAYYTRHVVASYLGQFSGIIGNDGRTLRIQDRIVVVPESYPMPGSKVPMPEGHIGRVKVVIDLPADLKDRRRNYYKFFKVKFNGESDWPAMRTYINKGIQLLAVLKVQEPPPSEEDIARMEEAREAKRKALKEQAEQRVATFSNVKTVLKDHPEFRIESELEDELLNITLPNDVKLRMDIDPTGTYIHQIQIPKVVSSNELLNYLTYLAKI